MSYQYEFESSHRKRALIFCNGHFASSTGLPHRPGYLKDLEALKDTFELLGFTVQSYTDVTRKQLLQTLSEGKWPWILNAQW